MFREMRRKRQQLSREDTEEILRGGTSGVLAVLGDGGYPYAVPLSYLYREGKIYFHCAAEGHKLDAIRQNEKVSFCVIGKDDVRPEEYTTCFRSVVAFGRARVLEGQDAWQALDALAGRYAPGHEEERRREMDSQMHRLRVVEIAVEHMTGKEAMALAKARG